MKTNILLPVTFGLLLLAGCSNETDLANNILQKADSSKLLVTTEQLEVDDVAMTRSFLSRDLSVRMYDTSDELRVYDNDLHRYDIYKFGWSDETNNKGVFTRWNPSTNLNKTATWALYPKSSVASGHWEFDEDLGTSQTIAYIRIGIDADGAASPIIYDGTYQTSDTDHEAPLFAESAPRWGKVKATATALETDLSYLTGLLRLQLANIETVNALRIQMLDGETPLYITGEFSVTLAINNEKQANATISADAHHEGTGATEFIVDLSQLSDNLQGADRTKAVVYVPLVTTSKPVDIVVSASKDGGQTWNEFKRFQNKTIQRAKIYGNSTEYTFAE